MKKGSKFLIGFATAALTFGTLMASLGPDRFGQHCASHRMNHHGYHHCGSGSHGDYNSHCHK